MLDENELLIECSKFVINKKGKRVLFKEGDASDALLFIVKGSARVTHKDARAAMAAYEDDRRTRGFLDICGEESLVFLNLIAQEKYAQPSQQLQRKMPRERELAEFLVWTQSLKANQYLSGASTDKSGLALKIRLHDLYKAVKKRRKEWKMQVGGEDPIVKEGWLTKSPIAASSDRLKDSKSREKQRYFVLRSNGVLSYFAEKQQATSGAGTAKGSLCIMGNSKCQLLTPTSFMLTVKDFGSPVSKHRLRSRWPQEPSNRVLKVEAETPKDCTDWIAALTKMINNCRSLPNPESHRRTRTSFRLLLNHNRSSSGVLDLLQRESDNTSLYSQNMNTESDDPMLWVVDLCRKFGAAKRPVAETDLQKFAQLLIPASNESKAEKIVLGSSKSIAHKFSVSPEHPLHSPGTDYSEEPPEPPPPPPPLPASHHLSKQLSMRSEDESLETPPPDYTSSADLLKQSMSFPKLPIAIMRQPSFHLRKTLMASNVNGVRSVCQLLNDDPRNRAIVAGATRVVVYSTRKKSYYACFLDDTGSWCSGKKCNSGFAKFAVEIRKVRLHLSLSTNEGDTVPPLASETPDSPAAQNVPLPSPVDEAVAASNSATEPDVDAGFETSSSRSTPPMVLSPGQDKPSHDPPELVSDGTAPPGHIALVDRETSADFSRGWDDIERKSSGVHSRSMSVLFRRMMVEGHEIPETQEKIAHAERQRQRSLLKKIKDHFQWSYKPAGEFLQSCNHKGDVSHSEAKDLYLLSQGRATVVYDYHVRCLSATLRTGKLDLVMQQDHPTRRTSMFSKQETVSLAEWRKNIGKISRSVDTETSTRFRSKVNMLCVLELGPKTYPGMDADEITNSVDTCRLACYEDEDDANLGVPTLVLEFKTDDIPRVLCESMNARTGAAVHGSSKVKASANDRSSTFYFHATPAWLTAGSGELDSDVLEESSNPASMGDTRSPLVSRRSIQMASPLHSLTKRSFSGAGSSSSASKRHVRWVRGNEIKVSATADSVVNRRRWLLALRAALDIRTARGAYEERSAKLQSQTEVETASGDKESGDFFTGTFMDDEDYDEEEEHEYSATSELQSPRTERDMPEAEQSVTSGTFFGEHSMLSRLNFPFFSIRAETNCSLLRLPHEQFPKYVDVVGRQSASTSSMLQTFKKRLVSALRQFKKSILSFGPPGCLHDFVEHCEFSRYTCGMCVLREGDVGRYFIVVVSGVLSVVSTFQANAIRQLGPGDYVGEVALISGHRNPVSVIVATDESYVLRCPKQYFLTTFATVHAPARAEFFLRVMRAKLELKHVIAHPRAIQYFRVDLRKQYADENLSCYELFERYRSEYTDGRSVTEDDATFLKRMHNDAQYVVMTYVKESAKKAVNFKHKQTKPVLQLVERASKAVAQIKDGKTVEPDEMRILLDKLPGIFDEVQLEVYQLMNRDSFGKFQKSALYKEMLKDIGSYSHQEINGSTATQMVADDARRFWRTSMHEDACMDRENVETVYSRIKLKDECPVEGASSMAHRPSNADAPTQWWDNTVIMPTFRNN